LEYDFQYHKMDFQVDTPVVVVSSGKSLLPCDIVMRITGEDDDTKASPSQPDAGMLEAWRCYLQLARRLPFDISQEGTEVRIHTLME
jgi:hypothetical protein